MTQSPLFGRGARRALLLSAAATAFAVPTFANGESETPETPERSPEVIQDELDDLRNRIDILAEEMERMTLGDVGVPIGERYSGLGPAASKIYTIDSGLSIGGYGELLAQDVAGSGDEADFLRVILYVGYRFDENWVLNTEIEIEHADEIFLEFATLDYLHTRGLNFRGGLVLIPMGFVNELHEPTTFWSARRPDVESFIIPSTWRENGLGIYGECDDFQYRAYVVSGFSGEDFAGTNGLRGGRQKGSQADSDDIAAVARVDYVGTDGLLIGGSAYYGNSGQDNPGVDGTVQIIEGHAQLDVGGFRARALYAMADVDDIAGLNEAGGLTTGGAITAGVANDASIGDELDGGYLEIGYDLFAGTDSDQALTPFVRYEMYDLQGGTVPAPFVSNGARDVDVVTFGIAWAPIANLVFKLDYQDYDDNANTTGAVPRLGSIPDRINLAMGYIF